MIVFVLLIVGTTVRAGDFLLCTACGADRYLYGCVLDRLQQP
jgi:hypothetical protein